MNNKKGFLKLLAIVCVIVMTVATAILPAFAIESYRTAVNGASTSYRNGKYYQYLMNVPLTGDGVTDVLAVALSQMGYSESNSATQMSGTVAGSNNYTEFNYNFGDVTGTGYKMEWCASFCSWALWQARVTPDGHSGYSAMCRNHLTDESDYYWREVSCDFWASKLKNMGMYGYRGSYTPKSGDLIFFNQSGTIGHMGIVVWCDGSTVYTIEGNTSSGAGVDGNGGGTYYKSYPLGSVGINGYGKLPYTSRADVTKVDYSGANKTAGFYMAKADFYVSLPVDAEHPQFDDSYKIPKYDMFRVTGFTAGIDGNPYAIIEHGTGRYYGRLNSNTIQITADQHQHSWSAAYDENSHFDECSGCEQTQNSAQHTFAEHYDGENHFNKCTCGYIKDVAPHSFEYVNDEDTHKRVCECGYAIAESEGEHSYTVIDSDGEFHYYRCECGLIDESTKEPHTATSCYDEDSHFEKCEICQTVIEGTVEAHRYDIFTNYDKCECGYDRSGLEDSHSWEISCDGENHFHKCSECGEIREGTSTAHDYSEYFVDGEYHYHMCVCGVIANDTKQSHVYDREGFVDGEGSKVHLKACACGALLEGSDEAHYYETLNYDENGHWFECVCGYKSEITAHSLVDGTCTECSHHVHLYSYDNDGHWLSCGCSGSGSFEEHTLMDGKCEICSYENDPLHEHSVVDGYCVCGYHEHTVNFNAEGHWNACGCYTGSNGLREHKLSSGKCEECGYVENQKVMHKMENGTCTDCGYHEHVYLYDTNGHKNICDCYLGKSIEKHTLKDGKCAVCGYNSKASEDTGDGTVEELQPGDSIINISTPNLGCGAAMGTVSAVMCVVLTLGCGIVFKKKED